MFWLLVAYPARPSAFLRLFQGNGLDVAGTVPKTFAVLVLVIDFGFGAGADVDGCGRLCFHIVA